MKETVEQFNRTLCDDLFQETMKDLDNLNTRDGTFDYADYVALNNDVCALYDSFSMIDSIIESLTDAFEKAETNNTLLYNALNIIANTCEDASTKAYAAGMVTIINANQPEPPKGD